MRSPRRFASHFVPCRSGLFNQTGYAVSTEGYAVPSIFDCDNVMSEFREATAAVAALSTRLQALRAAIKRLQGPGDVDAVVLEAQDALEFVRGALEGETNASMERFRARCTMVDPVTQAPRFGPKMMVKVTAMLGEYDATKLEAEESGLLASVADRIEVIKSERRERERQAEEQRGRAEQEKREAEAAEQRRREREEQERLQREAAAERERVAALARAAQLKREQRERMRQDEERRAHEEQERLDALRKTFKPGKEALGRAMDMLRESTGSEVVR